jgi:putative acetyltransferase
MLALEFRPHCALESLAAIRLIAALNAELQATCAIAWSDLLISERKMRSATAAVACGAVRRFDATTAELKRMYVVRHARRPGIERGLVEALEREARLLGITKVILETGTRLAPAIRLYAAMGYRPIPLFGEYLASPETSLCFGKLLV